MDKQKQENNTENINSQIEAGVNKPNCNICKKPIDDAWDTFEKYKYKTINGNIKEVWCCLDCQLNNLYKNND